MIGTLLATAGISVFNSLIDDHGQDLVEKGIEKVTGIKLDGKKELSEQDIKIIKQNQDNILRYDFENLKLVLKDKNSARKMNVDIQASKDWLVRNTGSLIAIIVVACAFILWFCMLIGATDDLNQTALIAINSSLTMALGYVLAFYFGESKTNADRNRGI